MYILVVSEVKYSTFYEILVSYFANLSKYPFCSNKLKENYIREINFILSALAQGIHARLGQI